VGNYACVSVGGATVKILDLSEPTAPKKVDTYELGIPRLASKALRIAAYVRRLFV
jgi:hypothetical protein